MADYLNDGKVNKMDIDYSATVAEKIPECEKLAKDGKLKEAIETLMALEKQTRTGADAISTGKILVCVVKLCHDLKKYDMLNENIVTLTKKRGQLKQAVVKMVQEVFGYVENTTDKAIKLKLIETLRTVCAGKIYVENERARLSLMLSKIREQEGNIAEAASVLQELQVETYGSMEKQEKVSFILEQMRLNLLHGDFVRAQIVSKKVTTKYFEDEKALDHKMQYYRLMIELDQHEDKNLAVCKHYNAIYNTPAVEKDPTKKAEALTCMVMHLIMSPFDNEQSDLIHRVMADPFVQELPLVKDLIELFTTNEIMRWTALVQKYEGQLLATEPTKQIFSKDTPVGQKRWKTLKSRIVEHNIRVIAKYYTRIGLSRLAELLDLSPDEAEESLSNLVVSHTVSAKIDRLQGVVSFEGVKDPMEVLNDWSGKVNDLMKLLNKATHLITKEEMLFKLH